MQVSQNENKKFFSKTNDQVFIFVKHTQIKKYNLYDLNKNSKLQETAIFHLTLTFPRL